MSKLTSYLFDLTNNYTSISYAQTRYGSLWEKGDCAGGQHIKKKFSRTTTINEENEKICIIKEQKSLYCSICGKPITRDSKSGKCLSCWQLKVFITKEELEGKIKEYEGNFSKVGRFYGITDNAVRNKCKRYGIPSHSSDYKEKKSKEKKQVKRAVFQIDSETDKIIRKFESVAEAARAVGKAKGSHITEVCKGKYKTAYGYKWEYAGMGLRLPSLAPPPHGKFASNKSHDHY